MDTTTALTLLRQLPLVCAMPEETRDTLATLFLEISEAEPLTVGDKLIQEGALGGATGYVLLEGAVEASRECAPAVRLRAPALFGEMQQFNPEALRTATVSVTEGGSALKFLWQDLYAGAREVLDKVNQARFLEAVEQMVWERFHAGTVAGLALFRQLPDRLRLRSSLHLLWIAQPRRFEDGETLFAEGEACGDVGFQLNSGTVTLLAGGKVRATLQAPELIGVMPDFDPERTWTATARAEGSICACRFSWQEYMARLQESLAPDEYAAFHDAAREAQREHFAW